MISATELRIGSKFMGAGMIQTVKEILDYGPTGSIQDKMKTIIDVTPGYSHLILVQENGNQYKPVDMEGIPLSSEILESCGFKFNDGDLQGWNLDNLSLIQSKEYDGRMIVVGHSVYNDKCCYISYLHQLQNLIFALTGTELTISQKENKGTNS